MQLHWEVRQAGCCGQVVSGPVDCCPNTAAKVLKEGLSKMEEDTSTALLVVVPETCSCQDNVLGLPVFVMEDG
jgi:hypothetical protein